MWVEFVVGSHPCSKARVFCSCVANVSFYISEIHFRAGMM